MHNLRCQLGMRKDVVEERLRTKLNATGYELRLGIGMERLEECVSATYPFVRTVKAEL